MAVPMLLIFKQPDGPRRAHGDLVRHDLHRGAVRSICSDVLTGAILFTAMWS